MKLSLPQLKVILKMINIFLPAAAPFLSEEEIDIIQELKATVTKELDNDST